MKIRSDHCTKAGAENLARRIQAYWAGQGYAVHTRVVLTAKKSGMQPAMYGVRSTLVHGLPNGKRAKSVKIALRRAA
jgi:hypothetical protein